MSQQLLWIDTLPDAVKALIDACGGVKAVAAHLRDDLDPDDAADWLQKALKTNRREVLSADHLLKLMVLGRRHRCDVLAAFLMDHAGYQAPQAIKVEAEMERVSLHVASAMEGLMREMQRLQRMQGLESGRP